MSRNNESIAAVVVTFNRLNLLKECISSLSTQSRKVNEIIVVNNSSTDGTNDWLIKQKYLTVITQENSGSAGGQYTGIKTAYEKGFDWIWCIDCDVIPHTNALLKLLGCNVSDNPKTGFLSSLIYYDAENLAYANIPELGNPYELLNAIYKQNPIPIISASFGSLLLPSKILSEVGYPSKDFFIWGDDAEFTLRIISKGYKGYLVQESVAQHFNPSNSLTPYAVLSQKDIKFQFGIRNMVYVSMQRNKITHNSRVRGLLSGIGFILRIIKSRAKLKKDVPIRYSVAIMVLFIKGILFRPRIEIPEKRH